ELVGGEYLGLPLRQMQMPSHQFGQFLLERCQRGRVSVGSPQQVAGRRIDLLGQGQLSTRQAGEIERAKFDEHLHTASTDEAAVDAPAEVEQAGEWAKGIPNGE